MSDPINNPSHYNFGKIECLSFIEDQQLNFHRGNALKYLVRAGRKDYKKEIEDLKKAIFYINREIERLNALKEDREMIKPNDMVEEILASVAVSDKCSHSWTNLSAFPAVQCTKCLSIKRSPDKL